MADRQFADDVIEELLEKLADGCSLVEICRDPRMPAARTIQRWANADDELGRRIFEAREVGFMLEADRLMEEMRTCEDAQKARNVLDATRWRLGKLSNAFRDKPIAFGAFIGVGGDDAFAAVAGALDRAAATLAGSGHATRAVAIEGPAGSGDADGGLGDLAGARGKGLGQDAGRS